MKTDILTTILVASLVFLGCQNSGRSGEADHEPGVLEHPISYKDDLTFLKERDSGLVELTTSDGLGRIVISPKYQGKVFTSTAEGEQGASFGWINYKAFDEDPNDHMNAFGGEDRLWLGPEGGPFALYFAPNTEMDYDHWHTPTPFDIESWKAESSSEGEMVLSKDMEIENYAGTLLSINVSRRIEILSRSEVENMLDVTVAKDIKLVGFNTTNSLKNTGDFEWDKKTGAPCLWNLDMFTPSEKTIIVIPYNTDTDGEVATTDYFGQIPADRIKMEDGVLYFKADGKSRGKLGLPANRSLGISGSYAADQGILTVTYYDIDSSQTYLNQEWTTDKDPFIGDAANAYNDGPLDDGSQMGPFYEIESVSPAAFLKPGEKLTHRHAVFHFIGPKKNLNEIAEKVFGESLDRIEKTFF